MILQRWLPALSQMAGKGAALVPQLINQGFKRIFGLKMERRYGRFSIVLPADHLLPVYQLLHKRYDRFLPHLARYLAPDCTVIDVGANCGDTLAAMFDANPRLNYVCIEADEGFFGFMQRNAARIKAVDAQASIRLIKALIGEQVKSASLDGSGGSKHSTTGTELTEGVATLASITLDAVAVQSGLVNVELVKSDVDGFDYDVIDSGRNLLERQAPLLFFECDFRDQRQLTGYVRTIRRLHDMGYRHWTIFDNFGDVVASSTDSNVVTDMIGYVDRQHAGCSTRTVHYLDVLAGTYRHAALMAAAVGDYSRIAAPGKQPA